MRSATLGVQKDKQKIPTTANFPHFMQRTHNKKPTSKSVLRKGISNTVTAPVTPEIPPLISRYWSQWVVCLWEHSADDFRLACPLESWGSPLFVFTVTSTPHNCMVVWVLATVRRFLASVCLEILIASFESCRLNIRGHLELGASLPTPDAWSVTLR